MKSHMAIIPAAACTLFLMGAQASADVGVSYGTGVIVTQPPTASPGTAFTLDFTPAFSGYGAGSYPVMNLLWTTQYSYVYSKIDIVLDASPTVFQFAPDTPPTQQSQMALMFYDPAYWTPGGTVTTAAMPQEWKDELADGKLSGRFWLEGVNLPPEAAHEIIIQGSATYLVPEPATLCLLSAGSLAMLLRKRRAVVKRSS